MVKILIAVIFVIPLLLNIWYIKTYFNWYFTSASNNCHILFQTGPVIPMPVPSSFNDITTDKKLRDFTGIVWYDREFYVSPDWQMKRVVLRIDSAHYASVVVCMIMNSEHFNWCVWVKSNRLLVNIWAMPETNSHVNRFRCSIFLFNITPFGNYLNTCFTNPPTTAETCCRKIKWILILFIIILSPTRLHLTLFLFFKLFISTFKIHNFNESKHIQNVEKEDAWSIAYTMHPP